MNTIEIIDGNKEFIKNKERISILEDINIKFEQHTFYAIMGSSGAGKSTLLNIIGTIDSLSSGKLIIEGKEIKKLNDKEKANIRMKEIGFIFQDFYLNKNMTIEENIMQPMYINDKYNKESMKQKTNELIDMFGLTDRRKHFPKELSGGEQQRVAIARALANEPKVILADEPTGNLDKENQRNVFEILKKLSQEGKCIIVVSHSNEVKKYADVLLELEDGNLKIQN